MKNNNEIHLSDLTKCLKNTHVKLDLEFLAKLLKNASKCESPAINKSFIAKIEVSSMKMLVLIILFTLGLMVVQQFLSTN